VVPGIGEQVCLAVAPDGVIVLDEGSR
jgi:ferredoxin